MNVEPRSGPGLVASIEPPCSSARCLAIERPRPRPHVPRVVRRIGLSETVEDVGQELGRDSLAGVGDDNPHALVVGGHGHVDAAAGARELDRVVNQIPENLLDATAIRRDARQVGVTGRGQPDAFRVGGRLERLDRRVDGGADIERPAFEARRSRRQLVHLEQVFDQLGLQLRVTLDDGHRLIGIADDIALGEHAQPSQDGIHRRPQLVAQGREELVLDAALALRLVTGAAFVDE